MPRRTLSNPLALAVLSCLFERPMHPYEVSTTLKRRRKDDSIKLNYGTLYSVVASLEKRGLIVAEGTSQEGNRPQRTVYAITADGEDQLVDSLRELLSTPSKEYPALEAALSLMPVLPPEAVATLLQDRAVRLAGQIAALEAEAAEAVKLGLPRLLAIESEYALAILRAEREFVDSLRADIESRTLGGYDFWARLHELRAAGVTPGDIQENPTKYFAKEDVDWIARVNEAIPTPE
ncbi:PadR family transcriptional regulator [Skermania sp. ID1734]|uniref:PadR family transcriptional regulator n=1 Tax=Skermania sp. ID1734 TaxID=2597516 RepID=UPI00117F90BF|nr:PadR family transcriptional regulator [Skermania sp. ID1734]TSE00285.1 PadR family transcriptional regulator [Skermania sp. ID1734]